MTNKELMIKKLKGFDVVGYDGIEDLLNDRPEILKDREYDILNELMDDIIIFEDEDDFLYWMYELDDSTSMGILYSQMKIELNRLVHEGYNTLVDYIVDVNGFKLEDGTVFFIY